MPEEQIFDHVNQRVRSMLATVQGVRMPLPAGGKVRQIVVDLDPEALKAHGLSPHEVTTAISAQNLVLPTGTAKVGGREYRVSLNSSPEAIAALSDIPIPRRSGPPAYLRDVAHVHDGFAVQTNLARENGRRSVVLSVMKTGDASTIEVARRVRELVPTIRASAPEGLEVKILSDQSSFVEAAIEGLLIEGLIAACLTAAMILLFLGQLAQHPDRGGVDPAVGGRGAAGAARAGALPQRHDPGRAGAGGGHPGRRRHGRDREHPPQPGHGQDADPGHPRRRPADRRAGLRRLAVHRHRLRVGGVPRRAGPLPLRPHGPGGGALGDGLVPAVADADPDAGQVPAAGRAGSPPPARGRAPAAPGPFGRIHQRFEAGFERFRAGYLRVLEAALAHPRRVFAWFGVALLGAACLVPLVGRDFFPSVDAGQIRLHVNAPAGTRLEETERLFTQVEEAIRELIPARDRASILDLIGMPGGYNLAVTDSANVSSADGEILVSLTHERSRVDPGVPAAAAGRAAPALPASCRSISSPPTSSPRS